MSDKIKSTFRDHVLLSRRGTEKERGRGREIITIVLTGRDQLFRTASLKGLRVALVSEASCQNVNQSGRM